jgi:hypothetical protein
MDGTITPDEMQMFTDFALQIMLPPNPVRPLDQSLTPQQLSGEGLFDGPITDTVTTCAGCHRLDPAKGFFGSGGEQSFLGEPQNFKIPHLRNLYTKVGRFGQSTGDQVRGFGFLHDGSIDSVGSFLSSAIFTLNSSDTLALEQYSLGFPSDLAPIVGQQVTLDATNDGVVNPRIDLMIARASTPFTSLMLGGVVTECDVVVKGSVGGMERGWVRQSGGLFMDDLGATITDAALRGLATSEGPLTYTCAPPGSGTRMGVDRDNDASLDGVDCAPLDAATYPGAPEVNDGLGNQCPGDFGFEIVDEISGDSGFHNVSDPSEYSWQAQAGATSYEFVRSGEPDFSFGCMTVVTSDTFVLDPEVPTTDSTFFYLNRALTPNQGSWGQDSAGIERTNICPAETTATSGLPVQQRATDVAALKHYSR